MLSSNSEKNIPFAETRGIYWHCYLVKIKLKNVELTILGWVSPKLKK